MLEYRVFGGSYLGDSVSEHPKSWFKKAKLSKEFNVQLNYFEIKSDLSLKEWKKTLYYERRSSRVFSMVLSLYKLKKNSRG